MKISYNWLKEFVPINLPIEEFCQKLTMFGIEVEDIIHLGDEYENIVVGKIVSVKPHPNSDHLLVCLVDVGENKPFSIICGAPNVKENQNVVVAKIGAMLGNFKIKKSKLRGIESYGMICSEKELGISDDHSGIMVLDAEYNAGTPFTEVLKIDDYVIDVEITPNRPDLLGMLGVAREVAVMLDTKYTSPKIEFNPAMSGKQSASEFLSVEIDDPELCPRYCSRLIKNITVKPSPGWMQTRLKSIGLRPINNIVDVTNYVLMEYGHPLHAFDYENISGHKIIVRRAKDGEKIELLDEQIYTLFSQNLVIADSEKPVALAGIMGGVNSGILSTTKDVVLECACFNPKNIRTTSLSLNLESDSSYRFERGMDPNRLEEVIDRAAQLIQQTAGGEICKGIVDVYPKRIMSKKVFLRTQRVNSILDIQLKPEIIKSYLQKFEFSISEKGDIFEITIPTFRPDLEREIDIIEEIARCYGYKNIHSKFSLPRIEDRQKRETIRKIRSYLVNLGFFEVCNLSFASPDVFDKLNLQEDDYRRNTIELANPLGEQFSILRTTLIPDLLSNVALNLSHKFEHFKLFELNNVYLKNGNNLPSEQVSLTGVIVGDFVPKYWNSKSQLSSFFDVKGIVESLFEILHCISFVNFKKSEEPFYFTGQNADVLLNKVNIGSYGILKKNILSNFEIKAHAIIFDINVSTLLRHIPHEKIYYKEVIKFPPVLRDIAIIVSQEISVAEIGETIKSVNPEIIKNVSLFDVYQGSQIRENHRSLAFAITFQSDKSTLTDKYIDKLFDKIVKKLLKKYKIELRYK
ncbi:MAG: phenylalanine--tRNA ligase subunit beta [Candidatus Cloacimonetes bacterium]|nr:phenylalanine--tRNA ligase subunit beta [Candidatus Cloacimonadota bacterium]